MGTLHITASGIHYGIGISQWRRGEALISRGRTRKRDNAHGHGVTKEFNADLDYPFPGVTKAGLKMWHLQAR